MIEQIAAIIGAISGLVSLGGIIYVLAYWKGGVDAWLKKHDEECQKYPPGEIALMCKTMWEIYVVGPLHDRPDLATHKSPFKLTQTGIDLIPADIKQELLEYTKAPMDEEAVASGWLVVKNLGIERIEHLAKEKELSVQEVIAILSTYLDNHTGNGRA
jgi:hypothetical protein